MGKKTPSTRISVKLSKDELAQLDAFRGPRNMPRSTAILYIYELVREKRHSTEFNREVLLLKRSLDTLQENLDKHLFP